MRDREVAIKMEFDNEDDGGDDENEGQETQARAKEDNERGRFLPLDHWRQAEDFV